MKKTIFILGLAGLIFSGYLSGVKFLSQTCALGETCPIFLGYPACYFGFVMYLIIFIASAILTFGHGQGRGALKTILAVSFLGILFAGYFTYPEISKLKSSGFGTFAMGLPTCAWGLIFYILIFTFSLASLLKSPKTTFSHS